MRLLLTGKPGIGKTTLIRRVLRNLHTVNCAGFCTQEVRDTSGRRIGFQIYTLDGPEGTLASIRPEKGPRLGRYAIHVEEFEALVLGRIDPARTPADLYVIDEIGKMELLSEQFRQRLLDLLVQPSHLLATIARQGTPFIEEIKRGKGIELLEVTKENRDQLPAAIVQKILREIHLTEALTFSYAQALHTKASSCLCLPAGEPLY